MPRERLGGGLPRGLGGSTLEEQETRKRSAPIKKTLFDGQGRSWQTARRVFRLASGTLGVRLSSMCLHPRYQAAFLERIAGQQSKTILKTISFLGRHSWLYFTILAQGTVPCKMLILRSFLISLGLAGVYGQTATTSAQTSSITGCHNHGSDIYCIDGNGHEVLVSATSTPTSGVPAQYTGCHSHGSES